MRVLKRNQLIILVIALILITAGYLNYTSENQNNIMTSEIIADLGDATLVSSSQIVNDTKENVVVENIEDIEEQESATETAILEDTYYTTSKLERDSMYSQMLETYQEIYNNPSSTAEQRTNAIAEIANINKTKNSIMIAENLIKTKGFQDVVIFSNTNSISVIINKEEVSPEEIAQVQNIVSRELGAEAEMIHISTKDSL